MAKRTIPFLTDGKFQGSALAHIREVAGATPNNTGGGGGGSLVGSTSDAHKIVTAAPYNADPTGVQDATAAIQRAIDDAYALGGGSVEIPAGQYRVSFPFIQLKGRVSVYGHGQGTVVYGTADKPITEHTGIFHTGTYENRVQDSKLFRAGLSDMTLMVGDPTIQHIPVDQMVSGICGVVLNTDLGDGPADPDAVPQIRNLEIWDTDIGLAVLGRDDQGIQFYNIRIRRCLRQGLLVGKPSDHPEMLVQLPGRSSPGVPGGPGGADNKFFGADVSSANLSKGGYAGIEIHTSQAKFFSSTSWYSKRYKAVDRIYDRTNRTDQKDGAGWFVKGTKNMLFGCTAQENGGHGFLIQYGRNQLVGCLGESNGFYDAIGDAAQVMEAAQFYVCNGAAKTQLSACVADNARGSERAARWGFYIEPGASEIRVTDGMAKSHPVGVDGKEQSVFIGHNQKGNVRIDVDDSFYSTLERDLPSTGLGAAALTPGEISGLAHHIDMTNSASVTTSGGIKRIDSVVDTVGNITFAPVDPSKKPLLSALSGLPAFKTDRAAGSYLFASDIRSIISPAQGYTIAYVASFNSQNGTMYPFSSIANGAVNPVTFVTTDFLEVRVVSNYASTGITVTATDDKNAPGVPVVVVARVKNKKVDLWTNNFAGSVEDPAKTPATLAGRVALGAYYNGTNAANMTMGEFMIFNRDLTDDEVTGLRAHLTGKWS